MPSLIYKSQNTRKFKRLRADYLVKYQPVESQAEPFVSNIKDIGAGGLKFWTDQSLTEGALLRISVWVPPIERTIHTLGRVTRMRSSRSPQVFYVAVRFIEISDEDQRALNEFIEYLALQPGVRTLVTDRYVVNRRHFSGAR